jgi:hypothetical protein
MAKRKSLPLVEVHWLDAIIYTDCWAFDDVEKKAKLCQRRTAGYLLYENLDGKTVIAGTIDPDNTNSDHPGVADVTVIPSGWVEKIVRKQNAPRKKGGKGGTQSVLQQGGEAVAQCDNRDRRKPGVEQGGPDAVGAPPGHRGKGVQGDDSEGG